MVESKGRVLLVAASNRRRGAEIVTANLVETLPGLGWDASGVRLSTYPGPAMVELNDLPGSAPEHLGRLDLSVVRKLRSAVDELGPQVVMAMGGATLRYAVASLLFKQTPLVYFAIGEPVYWLRSPRSVRINRWLWRQTNAIAAVSNTTAKQLSVLEPRVAKRTHVVHTGVPAAFFDTPSNPEGGPMRVLVAGSISEEKDPHLALAVVGDVEDVRVRFVGDGPAVDDLRDRVADGGLNERVQIKGSVDDMQKEYEWADILLLTSRTEGLPGVITEAAASGVPTLAVDVGGVRDAIDSGVTGLVVDRNQHDLTEALRELTSDRPRVAAMGEAARDLAKRLFTLDVSARHFDRVLESVSA